jgi:hypothetical protein
MRDWGWKMAVALLLAASAQAAKIYSFTGKVSRISDNDVEITRGSESREFAMSGMTAEQKDSLKVGEQITIWYTMEAQSTTQQQPGRVQKPSPEIEDNASPVPSIQDDRAFYNAKIDWSQDSSNGV